LVKTFSIAENGTEHIINFAPDKYWTGDRENLTNGTRYRLNIDAIEPTELILIDKSDFEKVCAEIPQLNQMVNQTIKKSFIIRTLKKKESSGLLTIDHTKIFY